MTDVNDNDSAPLVSVCVQTYQHGPYIGQCLEGILAQQTDFPIEVILGEDDSADNTRVICRSFAERYPDKIRLFLRSRKDVIFVNGQATGRYNFIANLQAARGRYVAFCEGDDYWNDVHKLQKQVDFLEAHPEFVISCHDVAEISEQGDYVNYRREKFRHSSGTFEDLVSNHFIPTPSIVFRNHLVEPLPEWFKSAISADVPFCLMLASHGKIAYSSEKMATHRHHAGGASKSIARKNHWLHYRIQIFEGVNQYTNYRHQKLIRRHLLKLGIRRIGTNLKRLAQYRKKEFFEICKQDAVTLFQYAIRGSDGLKTPESGGLD